MALFRHILLIKNKTKKKSSLKQNSFHPPPPKKKPDKPKTLVPVRKKGITSVLLTSFANKEPTKERVTYVQDTSSKSKANSNRDFYIGNGEILKNNFFYFITFL